MTWDERYRKADHLDLKPMAFLVDLAGRMPPKSLVLDLACGAGRHALLFASASCRVVAVDSSAAAIDLVHARNQTIQTLVCAADEYSPAERAYDLIVVTMFLDLELFPKIRGSVRSGGRVAMAIPLVDDREGVKPMNPAYLLDSGKLAEEFQEPEWELEHYIETRPEPPARRIAELVARLR